MVDVAGIPRFTGSMDAVASSSVALRVHAGRMVARAAELDRGWQGLEWCYSAPEGAALRAATGPVPSGSRVVARRWAAVADALDRFVAEAGPLVTKLDLLRRKAHSYDGVDTSSELWLTSQDRIHDHNHLMAEIDRTVAAWEEAQRRCANAINAQDSAQCHGSYRADDGDGSQRADEFGYTAEAFDEAATHGGVPWGKSLKREHAWTTDPYGALGQVAIGTGQAAWEFGRTVFAVAVPESDPERATAAYKSAFALSLSTSPEMRKLNEHHSMMGLPAGSITNAPMNFGKASISYDEWKVNPDRALGANIFTGLTFLGTDGVGVGARGLGVAGRAGEAAADASAGTRLATESAKSTEGAASSQFRIPRLKWRDPVTWRGEGGAELTRSKDILANADHSRTLVAGPPIAAKWKEIVIRNGNARMAGMNNYIKTVDSFKRKIAGDLAKRPDEAPSHVISKIGDNVRFTAWIRYDKYTETVKALTNDLEAAGYIPRPDKFKNSWGKSGYVGINSRWVDPASGQMFEVQFHTPGSYWATKFTHPIFEKIRLPDTPPAEREALQAMNDLAFASVHTPEGAQSIRLGGK